VALGAHVRTVSGLSGIGDLMVTCMSRHSRNRYVGVEIGKGRKISKILGEMVMVAEGVATTQSAYALANRVGVEVPIITEVHRILFEEKDPLLACRDLMTRDPKGEM
jgi:glycerol-3-phosphate dehydrogenase (NAD(P)+)